MSLHPSWHRTASMHGLGEKKPKPVISKSFFGRFGMDVLQPFPASAFLFQQHESGCQTRCSGGITCFGSSKCLSFAANLDFFPFLLTLVPLWHLFLPRITAWVQPVKVSISRTIRMLLLWSHKSDTTASKLPYRHWNSLPGTSYNDISTDGSITEVIKTPYRHIFSSSTISKL